MTKEELVSNLGTIARSGSKAFMETIKVGVYKVPYSFRGGGFIKSVGEEYQVVNRKKGISWLWETWKKGEAISSL